MTFTRPILPWWQRFDLGRLRERQDRQDWIDELAARWQLVRSADSLTPWQLDRQRDVTARALARLFYPTEPGTPVVLVTYAEPDGDPGYLLGLTVYPWQALDDLLALDTPG